MAAITRQFLERAKVKEGYGMLGYQVNEQAAAIKESPNGQDIEFEIQLLAGEPYVEAMRQMQHLFESNRIYTDVSFYLYPNHLYRVIVRNDYYTDFVLAMMKHRLLRQVEWK
jgi:hypothetical protein